MQLLRPNVILIQMCAHATDSHSTYSFGETSTTCICNGFSFYLLLQRDQHNVISRLKPKHPASETATLAVMSLSRLCHEIKDIEVDPGYPGHRTKTSVYQ